MIYYIYHIHKKTLYIIKAGKSFSQKQNNEIPEIIYNVPSC